MQSTIELLSSEALFHAQRELSKLIGTELEIILQSASLINKQGFLEMQFGRNTIIGLSVRGVAEGEGCLITAEKSVVRLAGKMLMLPASELNDIISSAKYEDEKELLYAFEKIAKCLIVSFLSPFQNDNALIDAITCQTQKIADGRKKMGLMLNHLSAEYIYYQVSATVNLVGVPGNRFSLLVPAFVLVSSDSFRKQQGKLTDQSSVENGAQNLGQTSLFNSLTALLEDKWTTTSLGLTTSLISHLLPPLQNELTNLLGANVQIVEEGTAVTASAEFLRQVDGFAHLRTCLSFVGPDRCEGWLIAEMTDAARLGLLLTQGAHGGSIPISLTSPFSADCQDGYNEICAVFIDVLSFVCQELSEGQLILDKTTSIYHNEPSQDTNYQDSSSDFSYRLSSIEIAVEGRQCGRVHLLLPTLVHEYQREVSDTSEKATATLKPELTTSVTNRATAEDYESLRRPDSFQRVLTIEATQRHSTEVLKALKAGGLSGDSVSFAEELHKTHLESYQAILVVVEKLDEIALGMVIKIKSISSVPLLVAAPQWTQTDVMKAFRYGVDEIIMLPVNGEELVKKITGLEPLSV